MTKEALKLALAYVQQSGFQVGINEVVTAIKEALAQPEQELVVGTKTWFEDGKVFTQHLKASEIYKKPDEEEYLAKAYRMANELRCHLAIAPAPQRPRVVFPTMLRKMWSGSDVQAWLDENVNKE